MKKIVAAFDSLKFSDSTLQYAIELAKHHHAHIVGVFLKEFTKVGYAVYATLVEESASGKSIFDEIERADQREMTKAITVFEARCREEKIEYSVHKDKGTALNELRHESLFADLLVVDAWETFSYLENNLPGWFIKNVLHEMNCPVLVVPKHFNSIKNLILLYDGSPSSIFAIKMFNYILPEMSEMQTTVLTAKTGSSSMHLPDSKLLKEWMKRHFKKVTYQVIKGTEREIPAIVKKDGPGLLIVAGAYHRSSFSMFFHKSLADILIQELRVPIFITHN